MKRRKKFLHANTKIKNVRLLNGRIGRWERRTYLGELDGVTVAIKEFDPIPNFDRFGSREVSSLEKLIEANFQNDLEVLRRICEVDADEILKYHGYALRKTDGKFFVIVEYVPHGCLKNYSTRTAIKQEDNLRVVEKKLLGGLRIALHVGKGLRILHELNIIHSNLKPTNVLMKGTRAVICDFVLFDQTSLQNEEKSPFLAPENHYTKKSDVFSFGNILKYVLTGKMPRKGGDQSAGSLFPLKYCENIQVRKLLIALQGLIEDCCKRTPEERPDLDQIINELEKLIPPLEEEIAGIPKDILLPRCDCAPFFKTTKSRNEDQDQGIERVFKEYYDQERNDETDTSRQYHNKYRVPDHKKINKIRFHDNGLFREYSTDLQTHSVDQLEREILVCWLKKDGKLQLFVNTIKKEIFRQYYQKGKIPTRLSESRGWKKEEYHVMKKVLEIFAKRISQFFGGVNNQVLRKRCKEFRREYMKKHGTKEILLGEFQGKGVCRHRAMLFKLICDEMNIKCQIIRGTFLCDGKHEQYHVWNQVRFNDRFLLVDASFAVTDEERISWNSDTRHVYHMPECVLDDDLETTGVNPQYRYIPHTTKAFVPCIENFRRSGMIDEVKKQYEETRECIDPEGRRSLFSFKMGTEKYCVKERRCDKETRRAATQEIFFLRFLDHPCILPMHCSFERKDKTGQSTTSTYTKLCTVRKLMDGNMNNFKEISESWKPKERFVQTLIIYFQIARALKYLEKNETLHLCLNSKHVLVNVDEEKRQVTEVRICDFTTCKNAPGNVTLRNSIMSEVLLKDDGEYVAPEVKRLDDPQASSASDVFSFGRMANDDVELFEAYQGSNQGLLEMIEKCQHQNPKKRPSWNDVFGIVMEHLRYANESLKEGEKVEFQGVELNDVITNVHFDELALKWKVPDSKVERFGMPYLGEQTDKKSDLIQEVQQLQKYVDQVIEKNEVLRKNDTTDIVGGKEKKEEKKDEEKEKEKKKFSFESNGRVFAMKLAGSDSVRQVKRRVEKRINRRLYPIRLEINRRELDDKKTVGELRIEEGDSIDVMNGEGSQGPSPGSRIVHVVTTPTSEAATGPRMRIFQGAGAHFLRGRREGLGKKKKKKKKKTKNTKKKKKADKMKEKTGKNKKR